MRQDLAETGAMRALAWLLGREALLDVFLGSTGTDPGDLRARAADPEFLASVLDFILMEDQWVLDCAGALGVPPQQIADMRQALPGGGLPHWT